MTRAEKAQRLLEVRAEYQQASKEARDAYNEAMRKARENRARGLRIIEGDARETQGKSARYSAL